MATETVSIRIKAFDQTQKALKGIQAAFGRLSKIFFSFKTALAGAVGAGGMGLLIRQSLIATDALAKTAGRIGTTTEALSKLQFAGSLAGIETNTLNMALQRFVRRTAEAAEGTGEAVRALRELGVDARRIEQLPLDERMQALASAFNRVDAEGNAVFSETEKLRLAFKLFDSEGTAMLNMLSANADEMGALFEEAQQLGLVMSSSTAQGVEDANDALTRLGGLFKGVITQTAAGLAPAIEILAEQFKTFVLELSNANGGVEGFGRYLAGEFIDQIIGTIEFIERFINGARGIVDSFRLAKHSVADFFGFAGEQPELLGDIDLTTRLVKPLQDAKEAVVNPIKEIKNELEEVVAIAQEPFYMPLINGFKMFANGIDDVIEKMPTIGQAVEGFAKGAMDTFTQAFTDAVTGAKNFGDAMKGLAKSVVDSLIKMLVQYYITKPLFDAISGGISGAFGGGGGAAGARASGGPVTAGRPYLVGEKGPELMVPGTNGNIVPNDALGGSGVTVVQNINVTTGVQQTVRAEIANLLPQISNAAKAAVADSRMRGGGFSKAMVGA